jgi:hypothetical protein
MIAILYSMHQETERIPVEELCDLTSMAGCVNAEDMIRIYTRDGKAHWCDSIEFSYEEIQI